MPPIIGIVLAAGRGRRMGGSKARLLVLVVVHPDDAPFALSVANGARVSPTTSTPPARPTVVAAAIPWPSAAISSPCREGPVVRIDAVQNRARPSAAKEASETYS